MAETTAKTAAAKKAAKMDEREASIKAALAPEPKHKKFKVIIFGADSDGPAVFVDQDAPMCSAKRIQFPRNTEIELDERYINVMKRLGRWVSEQKQDADGNPAGPHERTFHPRFKYSITGEVK